MYGLLITATGWTWEYVDENMTLPRFEELLKYWSKEPPVHVSVAAYLTGKDEPGPTPSGESRDGEDHTQSPQNQAALSMFFGMFPQKVAANV